MLEIILVVVMSQKLAGVARERGRAALWGGMFAVGWIVGEIVGFLLGAVVVGDVFGAYVFALAAAVAGGVAAWFIVKALPVSPAFDATGIPGAASPLPADAALPVAMEAPKPVKRAGYCMECGQNVWLTGTGSCPNGHGPQSLTKIYTVEG